MESEDKVQIPSIDQAGNLDGALTFCSRCLQSLFGGVDCEEHMVDEDGET